MSEEEQTTESSHNSVIASKKRFSLSPIQKRFTIVVGVLLLATSIYAGYSVWQDRGVDAASCVSRRYSFGNQNKCVKYIQQLLNAADIDVSLKVTGTFDKSTKNAVVAFQQGVELTGSGIVDLSTWQQLCAVATASVDELYEPVGCQTFDLDTSAKNTLSTNFNNQDGSSPTQVSNSDWFSIVSMPDTQSEVVRDVKDGVSPRGLVSKDMQWIVNNRNDRNIQAVVAPGDLTHAAAIGTNTSVNTKIRKMWASISKSYKILDDAGVPYSITTGNHDTAAMSLNTKKNSYGARSIEKNKATLYRDTSLFNQTFTLDRAGMMGITLKDTGHAENAYRTFRVKDTDWLILTMEYAPRREVLDWAKAVVSSHATYNVIIATHAYMRSGSTKLITTCDASDCVSAQVVHDELVAGYSNVKMLFSGHTIVESVVEEKMSNGNKVIQYRTTMHACMMDRVCNNPIRVLKIDLVHNNVTSELCTDITATTAKNCKTKVSSGMQFITSNQQATAIAN